MEDGNEDVSRQRNGKHVVKAEEKVNDPVLVDDTWRGRKMKGKSRKDV